MERLEETTQMEEERGVGGRAVDRAMEAIDERVRDLSGKAMEAVKRRAPEIPQGGHRFYAERPLIIAGTVLALGFGIGLMFSPSGRRSNVVPGSGHLARDIGRKAGAVAERSVEKAGELKEEAVETAKELKDRTARTAREVKRSAAEIKEEAMETAREVKDRTVETAKEVGHLGRETGREVTELGRETFEEVKEKGKETYSDIKEKGRESYSDIKEKDTESSEVKSTEGKKEHDVAGRT